MNILTQFLEIYFSYFSFAHRPPGTLLLPLTMFPQRTSVKSLSSITMGTTNELSAQHRDRWLFDPHNSDNGHEIHTQLNIPLSSFKFPISEITALMSTKKTL